MAWYSRSPAARVGIHEAREARRQLGLPLDAPLDDVLKCAEQLGPPVAVVDLDDRIAGAYFRRPRGSIIIVNRVHAVQRQRFTVAHEVGHHFLDHAHTGFDTPQDLGDFSSDPVEVQANWFASELLMPKDATRRWAAENLRDAPLTLEDVVRFACDFGVSAKAACIRLHTAGLIRDEKRHDKLHAEIDACEHYGMPEALGLTFPDDELAYFKSNGERKPYG